MEFLLALVINLLILALFILLIFWVLGMLGLPENILKIAKAIIGIVVLIWLLEVVLGHAPGFYTLPHRL